MDKLFYGVNVYGNYYHDTFFNLQVPSILAQTGSVHQNIRFVFFLYTTKSWFESDKFKKDFQKLKSYFEVKICILPEKPPEPFFENRYKYLQLASSHLCREALEQGALVHCGVADSIFGNECWYTWLNLIDVQGTDSVFILAIRAVAELATPVILKAGVSNLTSSTLFTIANEYLAPIWISSFWDSPRFTPEPFQLLWGCEGNLLVHNLGGNAVIFRPNKDIVSAAAKLSADHSIPPHCKKPAITNDLTNTVVVKLSELRHVYQLFHGPVFGTSKIDIGRVAEWLFRTSILGNKNTFALKFMLEEGFYWKAESPTDNNEIGNLQVNAKHCMLNLGSEINQRFGRKWLGEFEQIRKE